MCMHRKHNFFNPNLFYHSHAKSSGCVCTLNSLPGEGILSADCAPDLRTQEHGAERRLGEETDMSAANMTLGK